MNRDTLASKPDSDSRRIALQTAALVSERDFLAPLDESLAHYRWLGCRGVVKRGLVGNSAWGHSMRAKQIIAARWKKQHAKDAGL